MFQAKGTAQKKVPKWKGNLRGLQNPKQLRQAELYGGDRE